MFVLLAHADHRDLHSFPTRRSSDLIALLFKHRGLQAPEWSDFDKYRRMRNVMTHPDARSEEHTSELQSHVNLVCRLLLEKKKTIFIRGAFKLHSKLPRINALNRR